jgi:hypothetical protein
MHTHATLSFDQELPLHRQGEPLSDTGCCWSTSAGCRGANSPDGHRSREGARDVCRELRRQIPSSKRPGQPAGQARQQGSGGAGAEVRCAAIGMRRRIGWLHSRSTATHPSSQGRPCTCRWLRLVGSTCTPAWTSEQQVGQAQVGILIETTDTMWP